jgi:hypothetical protein
MTQRKTIAKERNQFVALALFRKAGSHTKSNKARRKQDKQDLKRTSEYTFPLCEVGY